MVEEPRSNLLETLVDRMGAGDPESRRRAQLFSALISRDRAEAREKRVRRKRRQRVKQKILQIQREHRALAERNEALAAALGACPNCWGEIAGCRTCRGRGTPGSMPLDEAAFTAFVTPVLKTLGLVQTEDSSSQPGKE